MYSTVRQLAQDHSQQFEQSWNAGLPGSLYLTTSLAFLVDGTSGLAVPVPHASDRQRWTYCWMA